MEILMKVKCSSSPNPNGSPARSTLKVIDPHQQLQQQHHNPVKNTHCNTFQHTQSKHTFSIPTAVETIRSPCLDYATNLPMDCCTAVSQKVGTTCTIPSNQCQSNPAQCPPFCEYATCCSGIELPACCAAYSNPLPTLTHNNTFLEHSPLNTSTTNNEFQSTTAFEYHEPEENFVSIDDEKIKAFLVKIGEEQKLKETQLIKTAPVAEKKKSKETFEIIELDVAEDVEKLQRLRESAEKRVKEVQQQESEKPLQLFTRNLPRTEIKRNSPYPCISLVPKNTEKVQKSANTQVEKQKEKIIARIDLIDSDTDESDNEGNERLELRDSRPDNGSNIDNDNFAEENDETASSKSFNPLLAAAAVSCELGCEEDDNDERTQDSSAPYSNSDSKIYILGSDDELEFVDEREEGPELRWDDFEEHSSSRERQLFECHICGKTVQSNYNLRRHMMIHTGERPFGCDLCDRRFREISDLKKHRRRHANQSNFFCMICRVNPPLETDSTRCGTCDTKNGTLIAAVRPDTVKPSLDIDQLLSLSMRVDKKKSAILNSASDSNSESLRVEPPLQKATTPPIATLPPLKHFSENFKSNVDGREVELKSVFTTKSNAEQCSVATVRATTRKAFACPLCKRSFGTRHNLKRHFMIHTGEKPFSCPHCRKPFREFSTLKKHLITHRRDRWYKCLRCSKKYRDFLDYMEHKGTHGSDFSSDDGGDSSTPKKKSRDDAYNSNDEDEDMDYDEECLECCECGLQFTDIEQFSEHIKGHDFNRVLYECYICQQLFEEQKDLVDHMNVKHQTETDTSTAIKA